MKNQNRKRIKELEKEKQRLERKIITVMEKKEASRLPLKAADYFLFGVVSDTQMGSLYEDLAFMKYAYDTFKQYNVADVYHVGDIMDGEKMYRGHEYEVYLHGFDAQIEHVIKKYPKIKGITTHMITGNHDESFRKISGLEKTIKDMLEQNREDIRVIGFREATISIGNSRLMLTHPSKGTAYAISYQIQKFIESLTGGEKPHILLVGHYHKAEWMPLYRNVNAFQAGCIQDQTRFMRERNIAAHKGFWIISGGMSKQGLITNTLAEFFPGY